MTKLIFFLFFATLSRVLYGQSYPPFVSLDSDPNGNIVLTARVNVCDVIAKYDSAGNSIWAKSFQPNAQDQMAAAIDPKGNIFVLGRTLAKAIVIDTTDIVNYSDYRKVMCYLVKLDSAGNTLWGKPVHSDYTLQFPAITIDALGNIVVAALQTMEASDSPTYGLPGYWYIVQKFDNDGNLIYGTGTSGYGAYPYGSSLDSDTAGNLYWGGVFHGYMGFGSGVLLNPNDIVEGFLAKYEQNGTIAWAKNMGGYGGQIGGISLSTNNDEQISVVGNFGTRVTVDSVTIQGYGDFFVSMFESSGKLLWINGAGGSDADWVTAVATDMEGSTYVTGGYGSSVIDFDSLKISNIGRTGSTDVFLAKYGSSGKVQWAKSFGGQENDQAISVKTDSSGNIFIAGTFGSSTLTLDNFVLNNNAPSNSAAIFMAKFDTHGKVLWAKVCEHTFCDKPLVVSVEVPEPKFTLYPNPAKAGELRVDLPSATENELTDLTISSSTGKLISRQTITGKQTIIPIDQYNPGVYFFYFANKSFSHVCRFVKL